MSVPIKLEIVQLAIEHLDHKAKERIIIIDRGIGVELAAGATSQCDVIIFTLLLYVSIDGKVGCDCSETLVGTVKESQEEEPPCNSTVPVLERMNGKKAKHKLDRNGNCPGMLRENGVVPAYEITHRRFGDRAGWRSL